MKSTPKIWFLLLLLPLFNWFFLETQKWCAQTYLSAIWARPHTILSPEVENLEIQEWSQTLSLISSWWWKRVEFLNIFIHRPIIINCILAHHYFVFKEWELKSKRINMDIEGGVNQQFIQNNHHVIFSLFLFPFWPSTLQ